MGRKVVQLVQGATKALEGAPPLETLDLFAAFPEIQVIDLDAAMGEGSNDEIVAELVRAAASRGQRIRAGGGVRNADRARTLLDQGVYRVIVGTAAFTPAMDDIATAIAPANITVALDSKGGKVVVKGWREATDYTAVEVIHRLEPRCSGFLCTYVDKEGMMQGTDLEWFRTLRGATRHEVIAAGGISSIQEIRALESMGVHSVLGMAIYTGRLDLEELARINNLAPGEGSFRTQGIQ
jgi:phosphoribosylformimino-5-aminoimidazole carboxamide ribotide isomerase